MSANEKIAVNDLIFNELVKRGYALSGNTRIWNIADSKLWYLTPEQSQAFLDLEGSKEYQEEIIQKEIDLINENIKEMLATLGGDPLNIIDLGCGDGKKAVLFIEHLKERMKLRYCPIDISSYMVEKAIEKIMKLDVGEVVQFQWNISDFENLSNVSFLLRYGDYKKNLMLLLGNTLGNFEINELLYQIRSSMRDGDMILIGNGLDNRNEEDILKSYDTGEMNEFLIKIIEQLGLTSENVTFGTRFINSRVEMYYTLNEEKVIKFQRKKIEFNKGDQIIVATSYKYNKEDFQTFLNMYFDVPMVKISKDGSYVLALCKK
jgi:uncharacterized SAM-dependent methyltransferase